MDDIFNKLNWMDFFLGGLLVGTWFDRWTLNICVLSFLLATNRPIAGIPSRSILTWVISFFRREQQNEDEKSDEDEKNNIEGGQDEKRVKDESPKGKKGRKRSTKASLK